MRRIAIVLAAVMVGFLFAPTAAEARPARTPWNGSIIQVVESLPSSWDVKGAVADIDWYTGSKWKIVKRCYRKSNCVHISAGSISGTTAIGYFHGCRPTVETCRITIDLRKASRYSRYMNYSTKRWLIRHELGHYRFLGHDRSCISTMYKYLRCGNGRIPPYAFTRSERAILRQW